MKALSTPTALCVLLLAAGAVRTFAAEPPADAPAPLELTGAERAWLAAHPVVRVGHDPTYPPWSFPDEHGAMTGIDPDFLALVAARTGLRFDHQVRENWNAMVEAFQRREVDVLMGLAKTEERADSMIFTRAYISAPNVIVTRSDQPFIFEMRELNRRRVSLVAGYEGLRQIVLGQAPDCEIVEYPDSTAVLEAVGRGEVYAGITDVVNASYLVKARRWSNLRLAGVLGGPTDIYIGVRRDWPELASILDKAIAGITPFERRRLNDRWVGIEYESGTRWWITAFRVAAVVAGIAVVVFVLAFLHNRRLKAELARRRRVQAELEAAHAQLARVSEEKTELLRMVAHDLRSPLTGVMLAAELLQQPGGSEEFARDAVEKIRLGLRRMASLINDLVDVNALESGQRAFAWAETDLITVVHDCVAALSETAAQKRIRIGVEAAGDGLSIRSDAAAVRQVLENLLTNAIKFSPVGSQVEVGAVAVPGGVRLFVRDQGPGIKEADREAIFEKYTRGTARPTAGEQSTGIGLWIVRRLVDGLGGRIRVESEVGKGACFHVELPARRARDGG